MNGEREAAEEDEKHAKQEERKRRAADRAVTVWLKNHFAELKAKHAKDDQQKP